MIRRRGADVSSVIQREINAVKKRTIACPSITAHCITFETLAASQYLHSLHAVSDKIQNNNSLITVIFANQTAALCSDSWNMIVL